MAGPISTNAGFDQVGHDNILRDIEQLYLLMPQSNGDMGNGVIQSTDMGGNTARVFDESGSGTGSNQTEVKYLGTLDLPIYGRSNSVTGNAAGIGAVDWQQFRSAATQVASGLAATITGGVQNTASGDYSVSIGSYNLATENGSVLIGESNSTNHGPCYAFGYNNRTVVAASPTGAYFFGQGNRCENQGLGIAIGKDIYINMTNSGSDAIHVGYGPAKFTTNSGGRQLLFGSLSTDLISISSNALYIGVDGVVHSAMTNNSINLMNNVYSSGDMTISGLFGCNGTTAQSPFISGGLVTVGAGANGYGTPAQATAIVTLLNNIRAALVANGIMS